MAAGVVVAALILALAGRRRAGDLVRVALELRSDLGATEAESGVAPVLGAARKVDVALVMPGTYRISYLVTSGWALVIAVLAFPIGLLALWVLRTERSVTVILLPDGDGCLVRVFGQVHRAFAVALEKALRLQLQAKVPA